MEKAPDELTTPWCERYLIRLRFTDVAAAFPFNHGGIVRGLCSGALGRHGLPRGLIPYACESGTVRFAPGDPYHLGLTLTDDARGCLSAFIMGLEERGFRQWKHGPQWLVGNFRVEAVEPLPLPNEEAQLAALADSHSLTLQFVSPLRLERPSALKVKGATYINDTCFPADVLLKALWKRLTYLGHMPESSVGMPPVPNVTATPHCLLWLDVPLPSQKEHGRDATLGGVVGSATLSGVAEPWTSLLVRGQYLHLGASTQYGFGRYRIRQCQTIEPDAFRPATTFRSRVSEHMRLMEATVHVTSQSTAPGVDRVEPEDVAIDPGEFAAAVGEELRAERYRASPMTGIVVPKTTGGVRALAIPTVKDRVVQRAAAQALGPAIETLLENTSHAYRRGYSRAGAATAIRHAYQAGYRYVLDADITAFFDSVDWTVLFGKLEALFPDEPPLEFLAQWIRAPVVFEDRVISRERGLPQGCGISPVLANLYLDEFDETLMRQGFRLVRYADDFVVLCRDLDEAQRARTEAARALAELGLTLNNKKTVITTFDDGFTYLGYLFCKSVVLSRKPPDLPVDALHDIAPDDIPPTSWLAQVPFAEVRRLVGRGPESRPRRVDVVPLEPETPPATEGEFRQPLYVFSHDVRLAMDKGTLRIEADGEPPQQVPLTSLAHVVLVGRTRATSRVLFELARKNVPVFVCTRMGELDVTVNAPPARWELHLAQAQAMADPQLRLQVARRIVAARLHNSATLVTRFK